MIRLFICFFIVLIGFNLFAHPASKVDLTFNNETSELKAIFNHKVRDTDDHYIYEVTVYLNDEEIIIQKLKSQESTDSGMLIYKITDAKSGDVIKVVTECNKSGKKSAKITLE